jgi:hypothetical protein
MKQVTPTAIRFFAPTAQEVKPSETGRSVTFNHRVPGSSPGRLTLSKPLAQKRGRESLTLMTHVWLGDESIFAPDTTTPSQWRDLRTNFEARSGLQRLQTAILDDALRCAGLLGQRGRVPRQSKQGRLEPLAAPE